MKKINGFEKVQAYTSQERLPVGGYVLKILNVEMKENDYGKNIVLSFDIAEGEYKDFFANNYKSQTSEDKKWKGNYRLRVPEDDAKEDDWAMRRFKTVIMNFEDSNQGYHWDWNEDTLKGKLIGGLFNNKEYEFNGRHGFFTNCHSLTNVERIREGKFQIPADTLLKQSGQTVSSDGFVNVPEGLDDELPF